MAARLGLADALAAGPLSGKPAQPCCTTIAPNCRASGALPSLLVAWGEEGQGGRPATPPTLSPLPPAVHDLAARAGVKVDALRRVLRLLAQQRIFHEVALGGLAQHLPG